jgi:hypothetical protein
VSVNDYKVDHAKGEYLMTLVLQVSRRHGMVRIRALIEED